MARPDKVDAVADIADQFRSATAAVVTEYRGLSVTQLTNLRRSLGSSTTYRVAKFSRSNQGPSVNQKVVVDEGARVVTAGLGDGEDGRSGEGGGHDQRGQQPEARGTARTNAAAPCSGHPRTSWPHALHTGYRRRPRPSGDRFDPSDRRVAGGADRLQQPEVDVGSTGSERWRATGIGIIVHCFFP